MLTPNDSSNHGQTPPARYPARQEILTLCELLRESRDMDDIRKLPEMTGASYRVEIHRPAELFADHSRGNYFRSTGQPVDKVVFLDPDNGFEPKNRTEKHVGYSDVEAILDEITDDSVVSVFQYFRRRRFDRDFGDIRPRIISGYAAAIYGRYVMFVRTSRSIDVSRSFDNPRPPELPELPRNHPHP